MVDGIRKLHEEGTDRQTETWTSPLIERIYIILNILYILYIIEIIYIKKVVSAIQMHNSGKGISGD